MFTIIGGDGKEYGPATVQQVRIWLAEGRASLDTKAKAAGTDEWRRLGDYAEFSPTAHAEVPPIVVPESEPEAELADRWVRLGAVLIDIVVTFIAALPGLLLLGSSFLMALVRTAQNGEYDFHGIVTPRMMVGYNLLLLGSLIVVVIQVWWLSARGQTIGKRALGIRIVRVADGSNPGFLYAVFLRNVVPTLISFIPIVGFIFSITDVLFIFRPDRRCLHDLIAGTRVVKVESDSIETYPKK